MLIFGQVKKKYLNITLAELFPARDLKKHGEVYGDPKAITDVNMYRKKPGMFVSFREAVLVVFDRGVVLTYINVFGKRISVGVHFSDDALSEHRGFSRNTILLSHQKKDYYLSQVKTKPAGGDIRKLCKLSFSTA